MKESVRQKLFDYMNNEHGVMLMDGDFNEIIQILNFGQMGIGLIAEERQRQVEFEGWTPEHDAKHTDGSIAIAGACYALPYRKPAGETIDVYVDKILEYPEMWPWEAHYWKPTPENRVKELIKAGALIAAEIDRLLASSNSD